MKTEFLSPNIRGSLFILFWSLMGLWCLTGLMQSEGIFRIICGAGVVSCAMVVFHLFMLPNRKILWANSKYIDVALVSGVPAMLIMIVWSWLDWTIA